MIFTLCLSLSGAIEQPASPGTDPDVVYAPLAVADARARTWEWLEAQSPGDSALRTAVEPLWQFPSGTVSAEQTFDAVLQTFYLADAQTRELVDACLARPAWLVPRTFAALDSQHKGPFYEHNVLYFYARYLAVGGAHEAALAHFERIDHGQLVDPAGSLFYRAVCEHALLRKEAGLKTLAALLDNTQGVTQRHRVLGDLMRSDLEAVEEKSLGEVARQMKDVRQRLSLGHSGARVQDVERRIVETLDELIKKLEEQQQSSSSSSGGSGSPQSGQPSSPMQDSQIGGTKGPGEVDKKELEEGEWGGLPEKEAADAKNLINRQFPAHYRQAVEAYLKRLADRPAPPR